MGSRAIVSISGLVPVSPHHSTASSSLVPLLGRCHDIMAEEKDWYHRSTDFPIAQMAVNLGDCGAWSTWECRPASWQDCVDVLYTYNMEAIAYPPGGACGYNAPLFGVTQVPHPDVTVGVFTVVAACVVILRRGMEMPNTTLTHEEMEAFANSASWRVGK